MKKFELPVFILENLNRTSGLENALNQILARSLKIENHVTDKIQSHVIGLCVNQSESSILSAESLVEVVRRCSVQGPSEPEVQNEPEVQTGSEIGAKLTLVSSLGLLSKLATKSPDKVMKSLMV